MQIRAFQSVGTFTRNSTRIKKQHIKALLSQLKREGEAHAKKRIVNHESDCTERR